LEGNCEDGSDAGQASGWSSKRIDRLHRSASPTTSSSLSGLREAFPRSLGALGDDVPCKRASRVVRTVAVRPSVPKLEPASAFRRHMHDTELPRFRSHPHINDGSEVSTYLGRNV